MNNLFRKYNQNRKTIWAVIIIVTFFVILLHTIFGLIRSNRDRQLQELIEQANQQLENNQANQNSQSNQTNQTMSNNSGSASEYYRKSAEQIINQFVEYCNNNQINQAYEMLTEDCKKVLFPTVNDFQNNYVQKIFNQNKTAKVEESMYGSTIYKVSYYTNVLSSGGYQQDNILQDYIRIVEENDKKKISLNKFLDIETLNKETNINSIYMRAVQKEVYIDFEIYQIQITNQTNNTILVSTRQQDNSVYIVDEKQVEYPSNIDEQAIERLVVKPQSTTILNLKFNKMYNQERKIKAIRFTDIVTNYEQYQNGEEIEIIEIEVQL